jgi:uncharacterized PurR-regulated membrane protein YhhQ (DUF165 family)
MKYACVAAFLATILLANYVTTELGMVSVGFGLTATAGTYLAGLSFVLRDSLQDSIRASLTRQGRGPWGIPVTEHPSELAVALRVVAVIAVGGALSFVIADPFIAVASACAFGLSELADLAVYSPMRRRGYLRAAIASNVVGSIVDTFVFLSVAGFPLAAWQGQVVGKLTVTAVAAALVVAYRAQRRAALA